MAVYYNPRSAAWRRLSWSKSVQPRVLRSFDFWLCAFLHSAFLAVVHFGYVDFSVDACVPLEVAGPLLSLAIVASILHVVHCAQRHQHVFRACSRVGEESLSFVQELQATLGRANAVLPLRFVAAKYAISATYAFFFTITSGSVTSRGWAEMRAKGLLDDDEVRFMDRNYHGDRMALLHIWAMWAAEEAVADPAVRHMLGDEALTSGLARMAAALRGAQAAAREVAGNVAVPVPYMQVQLHDSLLVLALLLWGALSAMPAITSWGASAAYAALLAVLLGLREAAAIFMDPFGPSAYAFPVTSTVNTIADMAAQLLVASAAPAFNPSVSWRDAGRAILTQEQIERRTPRELFAAFGASPCLWPSERPSIDGNQVPPPLTGIGCCHFDTEAMPRLSGMRAGHAFQVARRPTQDALGALLQKIRLEADSLEEAKGLKVIDSAATPPVCDHHTPWQPSPEQPLCGTRDGLSVRTSDGDEIKRTPHGSEGSGMSMEDQGRWITSRSRDSSSASEPLGNGPDGRAPQGRGRWRHSEAVERPPRPTAVGPGGSAGIVSPRDVGPVRLKRSRDPEPLREGAMERAWPPSSPHTVIHAPPVHGLE